MKPTLLCTTALLMGLLLLQCTQKEANQPALENTISEAKPTPSDQIKRGEYLVHTMGCHDCHSPKMMTPQGPVPDPALLLSGHPANEQLTAIADKGILQNYALFNMGLTAGIGPWGTTFAANLTPDETGIRNWTLEQFGKALREGKAKGLDGGRMLLPPMPWQNYVHLNDEDLSAIFAYLQSIPPVKNVVPAPVAPM